MLKLSLKIQIEKVRCVQIEELLMTIWLFVIVTWRTYDFPFDVLSFYRSIYQTKFLKLQIFKVLMNKCQG
jgi:hypothetical protein